MKMCSRNRRIAPLIVNVSTREVISGTCWMGPGVGLYTKGPENRMLLPQISLNHPVTVLMMMPQILEYSCNKHILRLSSIFQREECGFCKLHVHVIAIRHVRFHTFTLKKSEVPLNALRVYGRVEV